MQIFEHISFLSQSILRAISPAADTCQFNTLWPQLPEPLLSLEGQCIPDSDCTGFKTTGFCRGAANILVSKGNDQEDFVVLPLRIIDYLWSSRNLALC